jgi:hypothetical protein
VVVAFAAAGVAVVLAADPPVRRVRTAVVALAAAQRAADESCIVFGSGDQVGAELLALFGSRRWIS